MHLIKYRLNRKTVASNKNQEAGFALLFTFIIAVVSVTNGEIDVKLKVPIAVADNTTVKMTCDYNLNSRPLYSVKWYISKNEFYRYLPKEMPSKYVFPPLGDKVDFNRSDDHNVVINNVNAEQAGKYRCEVSTDTPFFITRTESSYMHVVNLPQGNLTLHMEKPRYSANDIVRGNCTAPPGNPPANLTWTVNGQPVKSSFTINLPTKNYTDNRKISKIGIEYDLKNEGYFRGGKLKVTCHANVFQLYKQQSTVTLEEERPRLASVLGTRESSHSANTGARIMEWLLLLTMANTLTLFIR